MAGAQKQRIVQMPKKPDIVDGNGNLTREYLRLLDDLTKAVNDLSARVKQLESQ